MNADCSMFSWASPPFLTSSAKDFHLLSCFLITVTWTSMACNVKSALRRWLKCHHYLCPGSFETESWANQACSSKASKSREKSLFCCSHDTLSCPHLIVCLLVQIVHFGSQAASGVSQLQFEPMREQNSWRTLLQSWFLSKIIISIVKKIGKVDVPFPRKAMNSVKHPFPSIAPKCEMSVSLRCFKSCF